MGIEIERKFLVLNDEWRKDVSSEFKICQGYLSNDPQRTVRIRTRGTNAFLTIKGKTKGISRLEFEYEIPVAEAEKLFSLCIPPMITKTRSIVNHHGKIWEIDVFENENEGLVVAEVELEHSEEEIILPEWIGEEVSDDHRYYNANLINHPFRDWKLN